MMKYMLKLVGWTFLVVVWMLFCGPVLDCLFNVTGLV